MGVTLWMAMSLNGMTARTNHSEDFLSGTDWDLFIDLVRDSDALVWGRITHELFEERVRPYSPDRPIVVVTSDAGYATRPGSLRASSPGEAVETLRAMDIERILLAGGSALNGAFIRAGLVDEVVLGIEPVVVARGLPLLRGDAPDLRLQLVDVQRVKAQTLLVRYKASKSDLETRP